MIQEDELENRVSEFKSYLSEQEPRYLVQKNIIFGGCAVLNDDQYLKLRSDVACQFNVHPNDVLVVGSAKLGFSIAPHKRYRIFCDESDIDLVIVSGRLFDEIWYSVYEYWKSKALWDKQQEFQKYLFRGWIRPDLFPTSNNMKFSKVWWEFFRSLTASGNYGPYKITGALYKSWEYIEHYQIDAITQCKESLG